MADPDEPPEGVDGVRLDAFELTERARDAYGPDGRPAHPHTARWPIFPFVTETLLVRTLEDPVLPEPPRRDETADDCGTCAKADGDFVWTNERWLVDMPAEPMSLPGATLHPRRHLDFPHLTEDMGAELGVLVVRLQRALGGIEGVGNVHVYKWGDGGAHLHVFVVARPRGMMQLRGMFLTTWLHVLPPLPADAWRAIRSSVASSLAAGGAAHAGCG